MVRGHRDAMRRLLSRATIRTRISGWQDRRKPDKTHLPLATLRPRNMSDVNPPFILRPAVPEDAGAIAELCNGLAVHSGESGTMMDAAKVLNHLLPPDSGFALLVAERNGAVVGYALYQVAYESAHGAKGLYLSDLFVAPKARRMGIASALIAEVAARGKRDGGEFLWWVEKVDSPVAKTLYGKLADISVPVTAFAATRDAFDALAAQRRGGQS